MTTIDWYERRDELKPGMVFRSNYSDGIVKLDQRVAGDGTRWNVLDWFNGHWSSEDSTAEPSDLGERLQDME